MKMEEVKNAANWCLNCKLKPCSTKGCPMRTNIPEFISEIKKENFEQAFYILQENNIFSYVCGIVCPQEEQCEGSCVRGIKQTSTKIGALERFVNEWARENNIKPKIVKKESNGKKVAIVGSGPAGLECAVELLKEGFDVTIFEKDSIAGGILTYGIPDFRLPKEIVKETVNQVLNLGVNVIYNKELGKNLELKDLEEKYDAIFLSIGANISSKMEIEGEELKGVYGGNELLEYNLHPIYKGKKVAVIGGGNVAMDCARTIKRLGANEVKVVYRRAREQMPAENKEIEDAIKEGVKFLFQHNIVKVLGNGKVEKMELIKTQLVEKEGESRLVPVNIENSNYIEDIDYIIMALGSKPENFVSNLGLELNKWGNVEINENYQTSNPKIYSGGDLAGVKGTVAWAAKSGREAAKSILENMSKIGTTTN